MSQGAYPLLDIIGHHWRVDAIRNSDIAMHQVHRNCFVIRNRFGMQQTINSMPMPELVRRFERYPSGLIKVL